MVRFNLSANFSADRSLTRASAQCRAEREIRWCSPDWPNETGEPVIELQLVGVRVELPTNQPIVLLKEREGERYLPIWIGPVEATAIALGMQGIETQRPMTHDLMRDLLQGLGVSVNRIVITELREGTFYAEIQMSKNGDSVAVSSRPSDALALAVRMGLEIFAEEDVLDEASIAVKDDDEADAEKEVERFREFLEQVSPEDFK